MHPACKRLISHSVKHVVAPSAELSVVANAVIFLGDDEPAATQGELR